jgi:hypothetical protein
MTWPSWRRVCLQLLLLQRLQLLSRFGQKSFRPLFELFHGEPNTAAHLVLHMKQIHSRKHAQLHRDKLADSSSFVADRAQNIDVQIL